MDINATLFGQMLTFAVLIWFTMKYVWPMLQEVLNERKKKIADGLYAAERGHKELELAQKNAMKTMREAREQAQQVVELARKQAYMIVEAAKLEANQEKEKILALGRSEIAQQIRAAEELLQGKVVDLVTVCTEKLLHRAVNDSDQKRLLEIEQEQLRSLNG